MGEGSIKTGVIGFTDSGELIVLPEHSCAFYRPGHDRLLDSRTCWYCRWADFRKTTDVALTQSVCRCPENRVSIRLGSQNEEKSDGGHENE